MTKLKRTIGKKTLLILSINSIIGSSIFFVPGIAASYAGSASILAWIAMSVIAIIISTYFAELVSMFPKSGGAYEFVKNAFGKSTAFLFGWMSWIVSSITVSMLVVGSLIYIFPDASASFKILSALFFILLFNFINTRIGDVL